MVKHNCVYILKCGDGTFYTGWSNDIEKRIENHRAGKGAKYTKGRGPLKLIYKECFNDKSQAMKREFEIKKMTHAMKYKLIVDSKIKDNFNKQVRI